jgi:hypothetical protein
VTGSSSSFKRLVLALAITVGAVACLVGWLFLARHPTRPEKPPPAESMTTSLPPDRPEPAQRPPRPRPASIPPGSGEHLAADGIGFVPLHDDDPRPPGPLHAHPIDPIRQRIFAENRIASALDDATDAKDVTAMKRLLEQYHHDFPEDQWQLQGGYAVIIGCLEHPGAESRAAAERWLDENNGSTVKRSVLRNCIEPQQP